jgi:protein-L-isoaspartate(D-aspartate) O-methyltransferase
MTTASPLPSPGREARRLLGRGAGRRAAVLCAADTLDPCRRQSGDGSRLRSHPALDLLKAAALDRVLAVHRLPALSGSDPVVHYKDLLIALDPARGVDNGSPSLHAKLLEALAPKRRASRTGRDLPCRSYQRARRPWRRGAMARNLGRRGLRQFRLARPADRWIEGLAPARRLVFPLSILGPKRVNSGGRHSDRGAALRIKRRTPTARLILSAPRENSRRIQMTWHALRAAFDAGGLDTVRSLIWKRPALPDRWWFAGKDWALSRDETA